MLGNYFQQTHSDAFLALEGLMLTRQRSISFEHNIPNVALYDSMSLILAFWFSKSLLNSFTYHRHASPLVIRPRPYTYSLNLSLWLPTNILAVTCDFQQRGILTSVHSNEQEQPPFKLRNSK